MIPIQLRLRNFLSYGEDVGPLDFTPIKLACLSGRNGHGKSALLDAMTWALWGEARKAGYSRSPDADLLHQGAEEMAVEFTFSLEGREYQVYREYVQKKKSTSKLEFRARESDGDGFIVLTGSSKKETQQRITDTLGLDYRTFVNSSFLLQGKADEFTRQSPKDRKEILSKILGLDYYERLLDETKQRLTATKAERKILEETIETINTELEGEENIRQQEKELNAKLQEKEKALSAIREERNRLQQEITRLERIQERIQREIEEETHNTKQIEELNARQKKLSRERGQSLVLIEKEGELQNAFARYEAVGNELKVMIETEQRYRTLDGEKQKLEQQIESAKAEIRVQLASLNNELEHLERNIREYRDILNQRDEIERQYVVYQQTTQQQKRLEMQRPEFDKLQKSLQEKEQCIERERQTIAERIAELRGSVKDRSALQTKLDITQKQIARIPKMEEERLRLKQEMDDIVERGNANNRAIDLDKSEIERGQTTIADVQEKLVLLRKGDTQDCPLCGRDLDEAGHREIEKRLTVEIETTEQRARNLTAQIKEKEATQQTLRQRYRELEPQLKKIEEELSRLRVQQQQIGDIENELKRFNTLQQELEVLVKQLDRGEFATENRKNAERIREQLKTLDYDPDRYTAITKTLQEQHAFESQWKRLQETNQKLDDRQKRLDTIKPKIDDLAIRLDQQKFAQEEQIRLAVIRGEMEPLEKELARRKTLLGEQERLKNSPAEWNQVCHAKERLPELEDELKKIESERDRYHKRLQEILQERQSAEPSLRELKKHQETLKQKETLRAELENGRNQAQLRLGGALQRLEHLKQRREERKEKRERLATASRNERLYDVLRKAFSRDGIPAMIVEESLPELQNDTNRLLQRLTDGRCSVAFESQREMKSGGIGETLDIKISDEIGTRDYEMFSGGEAFRADLSIRIALSHLLCRRAGSKLQLLVIDEGFGTQDSEGLGHIVYAINDIQDEFEKVLVVTHLDELKDQFLTRIEVTKEPGIGSHFEIVHAI